MPSVRVQDALDEAEALNADTEVENDISAIWIAEGVYMPTKKSVAETARTETFALVDGVSLYGAFGGDEGSVDERERDAEGNWAHETVLSGDLLGNDDPGDQATLEDNAFTVVLGLELTEGVALNGLTITAGRANGPHDWQHREWQSGGGVFHMGGALSLILTNLCSNSAFYDGAGISSDGLLIVTGCYFWGNTASGYGGGIFTSQSDNLSLTNCALVGNSAYRGGGVFTDIGSLTMTNSTLVGNTADRGGGAWSYHLVTVRNSIIAMNEAPSDPNIFGRLADGSSHNLMNVDPAFVRNPSDGGDGWGDNPDTPAVNESANDDYGDLHLTAHSAAIDFGDTSLLPSDMVDLDDDGDTSERLPTDVDGNLRVYGTSVDCGAYEFQSGNGRRS